jgi:hypothetical protein
LNGQSAQDYEIASSAPDGAEIAGARTVLEGLRQKSVFRDSPLTDYCNVLWKSDISLSKRDALEIDLTWFAIQDLRWRWAHDLDAAINIHSPDAGKGKSNAAMWYALQWSEITGKPFHLSDVVYSSVAYNLLLKGIKLRDSGNGDLTFTKYEAERGQVMMLDEAGDVGNQGQFVRSTIAQSADIENRARILQWMRLCAGVSEEVLMHGSNYNVYMFERIPEEKKCIGIVYRGNWMFQDRVLLGRVEFPYVPPELFKAYEVYKIRSIGSHARSGNVSQLAKLKLALARAIADDEGYLALPKSPKTARITYLQSRDEYALLPTKDWFVQLMELAEVEIRRRSPLADPLADAGRKIEGLLKKYSQ